MKIQWDTKWKIKNNDNAVEYTIQKMETFCVISKKKLWKKILMIEKLNKID